MYRKGKPKDQKTKQQSNTENQKSIKNPPKETKHLPYEKQLKADRHLDKAQIPLVNMNYKDVLPFISVFSHSEELSQCLYEDLVFKLSKYQPKSSLCTVSFSQKQKVSFFCGKNTLETMVDLCKCSDLMIIILDSRFFDIEFFEMASLLKAFGICKLIVCVKFYENKHLMYRKIKRRVWKEVCNGLPVVDVCDIDRIARLVRYMKYRPLSFKCSNSYVVVDRILSELVKLDPASEVQNLNEKDQILSGIKNNGSAQTNANQYSHPAMNDESTFEPTFRYQMFGYVRGCPFDALHIHIPGKGDFNIQNIKRLPDPCTSEKKLLDKNKIVVYNPVFHEKMTQIPTQLCANSSDYVVDESSSDVEILSGMTFRTIGDISEEVLTGDSTAQKLPVDFNVSNAQDITKSPSKVHEIIGRQNISRQSRALNASMGLNSLPPGVDVIQDQVFHPRCDDIVYTGGFAIESNIDEVYSTADIRSDTTPLSSTDQHAIELKENGTYSTADIRSDTTPLSSTDQHAIELKENGIYSTADIRSDTTPLSSTDQIAILRSKLKPFFTKEAVTIPDFIEKFHSTNPTASKNKQPAIKGPSTSNSEKSIEENTFKNSKSLIPGSYVQIEFLAPKLKFNELTIVAAVRTDHRTILQGKIKKNIYFDGSVKSNDETLVSIGWYRYYTSPVFSIKDAVRNRFLKYIPNGMYCSAAFCGNVSLPGTPFCFIKVRTPLNGYRSDICDGSSNRYLTHKSNDDGSDSESLPVQSTTENIHQQISNESVCNVPIEKTKDSGVSIHKDIHSDRSLGTNTHVKRSKDAAHGFKKVLVDVSELESDDHNSELISDQNVVEHPNDAATDLSGDSEIESEAENPASFPDRNVLEHHRDPLTDLSSDLSGSSGHDRDDGTDSFPNQNVLELLRRENQVSVNPPAEIGQINRQNDDSKPHDSNDEDSIPIDSQHIKYHNDAHFRVAAFGTIQDSTGDVNIVKKIKIIGYPYRIHENTAFIKDMFTSEREAVKFENTLIKTVSNIRGIIKKALKDGSVRCSFEARICMSDIVFMRCFVRYDTTKLMDYSLHPSAPKISLHYSNFRSDEKYSENLSNNDSDHSESLMIRRINTNVSSIDEKKRSSKILKDIADLRSKLTLDKQQIDFRERPIHVPFAPADKEIQRFQEEILSKRRQEILRNEADTLEKQKLLRKTEMHKQADKKERLKKNIVISQIERKMRREEWKETSN